MKKSANVMLNRLIAQAKDHAKLHLQKNGAVMPAVFYDTTDGEFLIVPRELKDEQDMDQFAVVARLLCRAHDTHAVAMVSEVWVAPQSTNEPARTPPGKSKFWRECVVISAETDEGDALQVLLPILRSASGGYAGLGVPDLLQTRPVAGRCANFLPRKKPNARIRQVARCLLMPYLRRVIQSVSKPDRRR